MDRDANQNRTSAEARPLHTAVVLSVGSELTTGETRDTSGGDLARSLTRHGVEVRRLVALPDRLAAVVAALREALEDADLVVTTGGLGPTPDDLTREAIAEVAGETPVIDPELETWLRGLFERRRIPFAQTNIKQAWLIPSATAVPNARGTAPGWWLDRPDGRVVVALPGPPVEMRAMWEGWVLERLRGRGLGRERSVRTYRLSGIGESLVAAALGEPLLRAENPIVATYARADAVDVRISAHADEAATADELVERAAAEVLRSVGRHVWGRDDDTWPDVLGRELAALGWTLALTEVGTGGSTLRLFGDAPWLVAATLVPGTESDLDLGRVAAETATATGATIGLAVRAVERGGDTAVELAASGAWGVRQRTETAFLGGSEGRRRAALAAAAFVHGLLREASDAALRESPPKAENTANVTAIGGGGEAGR